MAFGMNMVVLIGRIGTPPEVRTLPSGNKTAGFSLATDASYRDKDGQLVSKADWHNIVTYQPGLIDVLSKYATKGRLVAITGKVQNRKWRKEGEDTDRVVPEVVVGPGHEVNFLDKFQEEQEAEPAAA